MPVMVPQVITKLFTGLLVMEMQTLSNFSVVGLYFISFRICLLSMSKTCSCLGLSLTAFNLRIENYSQMKDVKLTHPDVPSILE